MDENDLINTLNELILELMALANDADARLEDNVNADVPGTDVPDEVKLDVLRTLAQASAKIA